VTEVGSGKVANKAENPPASGAIQRLLGGIPASSGRSPAPVHLWNPPYCGEIDMRIAADGSWSYMGSPINRPAMVKLFSTILRKDSNGFVLVTPVERVGIKVDDAPFLAVDMASEAGEHGERLVFRTNLDEIVRCGRDHPLKFLISRDGAVKPYLHVRGDLWALATRSLTHDLVAMARVKHVEGNEIPDGGPPITGSTFLDSMAAFTSPDTWRGEVLGVSSDGVFFPIAHADDAGL
jgi:hypothetical protein